MSSCSCTCSYTSSSLLHLKRKIDDSRDFTIHAIIVLALLLIYTIGYPQSHSGSVFQQRTDQSIQGGQGNAINNNQGRSSMESINVYGSVEDVLSDQTPVKTVDTLPTLPFKAQSPGSVTSTEKKSVPPVEPKDTGSDLIGP